MVSIGKSYPPVSLETRFAYRDITGFINLPPSVAKSVIGSDGNAILLHSCSFMALISRKTGGIKSPGLVRLLCNVSCAMTIDSIFHPYLPSAVMSLVHLFSDLRVSPPNKTTNR